MSHVDDGTLHAYLDGELPAAEQARVEAHVADCPACRARLDEERALSEHASHLLGLVKPPDRAAPPLHQLRQPRLVWRLRVPLAWAASLVLAVGLGYYAGGMEREQFAASTQVALFDSVARPATPPAAESANYMVDMSRAYQARPEAPRRLAERPAARDQVASVSDELAARARPDSAVSGVVPIQPQVALRGGRTDAPAPAAAAPAPVPEESRRVETANAVVAARGRQVTTEWQVIRREPARRLLGTDPVAVPGLAIREIRRSPAGQGAVVVVVEQQIDATTVIQLFQQSVGDASAYGEAVTAPAQRLAQRETERLAKFVGSLRVEIAGPLPPDSLNKLLEQVRPIP